MSGIEKMWPDHVGHRITVIQCGSVEYEVVDVEVDDEGRWKEVTNFTEGAEVSRDFDEWNYYCSTCGGELDTCIDRNDAAEEAWS